MTTTSTKVFLDSVRAIRTLPDRTAKTAVKLNTANGKANAEKSVKQATNGSARLRNAGANASVGGRVVGKKGATLAVSAKVLPDGTTGRLSAVGPWQLIENDSEQHFIGPAGLDKTIGGGKSGRKAAKARTGRATALRTPFGLKRWVYVKGTKGKHPWGKARDKTTREAPQALRQANAIEVKKVIR